jgi:hypothetical protein
MTQREDPLPEDVLEEAIGQLLNDVQATAVAFREAERRIARLELVKGALGRALRDRQATIHAADNKAIGVWCWQGDGEDHPESLTCPILISADNMRAVLAARAPAPGWRDAESAPRDGTPIVAIGYLAGDELRRLRACLTSWGAHSVLREPGWVFCTPGFSDAFVPLLWLPAPPSEKGAGL